MRRLIVVLVTLIIFFITNLILFNFSEDYKFFIKKLKNPDSVIYVKDSELLDEIDNKKGKNIINSITWSFINNTWVTTGNTWILNTWNIDSKNMTSTWQVILWKQYQNILDKFSYYNLWKLELPWSLFDLTQEYPDDYYEYYSKNLTLYFFVTKSYSEVLDVFQVLTYDLPFTINKTDSFWDSSFFINLKWSEKEWYIRIITSIKGFVFWLKFKKDQYDKIKEILKNINNENL